MFLFLLGVLGIISLGSLVFIIQLVRKPLRGESVKDYFYTLAIGLDQLGGSLIYGLEDWTISSVAYYDATTYKRNIWFMNLINFLFNDKQHCMKSYYKESEILGTIPTKVK